MSTEQNEGSDAPSTDEATSFGPFRVLVFEEECRMPDGSCHDALLAQGIDYDICVQGKTRDELRQRFWKMVMSEIAWALNDGEEPLARARGTVIPPEFSERYRRAEKRSVPLAGTDGEGT